MQCNLEFVTVPAERRLFHNLVHRNDKFSLSIVFMEISYPFQNQTKTHHEKPWRILTVHPMQSHQPCFAYAACTPTTNASSVRASGILTPLPRVPIGPAAKRPWETFPFRSILFFSFFHHSLQRNS